MMGYHQRIPPIVVELERQARVLAGNIGLPYAMTIMDNGLYVRSRMKRDPINNNRKRRYLTVRLRRDGVEVFRSEEIPNTFPTDHLITQLMLVK